MNPIISIVMPIYNAECFLSKTIESILQQSLVDFELILVNDGSMDGSLSICEIYRGMDSRVKIIDKSNTGANDTRGIGVENASGDYIYFMDADDTIGPSELETLYNEIGNVDILLGGCKQNIQLKRIDFINALLNYQLPFRLWGNLYKREILELTYFQTPREIKMGEDMLTNLMIAKNATSIKAISFSQYNFDVSNSNSVSRSFIRNSQYEKKFDSLLTSILSTFISSNKLNVILARQRFESLKYLLIEDKNIDLTDEFVKNLFSSAKFLPLSKYGVEKIIMSLRPIEFSAFLLRGLTLFKRKFL